MRNENRITLEKGVVIFREKYRAGHPSAGKLNPVWHYKIKLARGTPAAKRSTGETRQDRAASVALAKRDELRGLKSMGISTDVISFKEVTWRYIKSLEKDNEADNETRAGCSDEKLRFYTKTVDKQLNPFFKERGIATITGRDLDQYKSKRQNDTNLRKQMVKTDTEATLRPKRISKSHLSHEMSVLRGIFRYAVSQGFINLVPPFPKLDGESSDYKKGLTKKEWQKLHDYIVNDFVAELDGMRGNSVPQYYRQSFVDFFRVKVWTGMRKTEILKLKWKDFTHRIEDGEEFPFLTVRAEEKGARKTRNPRTFKISDRVAALLDDRRTRVHYPADEDYIFAHPKTANLRWSGRNIAEVRNTFEKALDACGLLYDEDGKKRTPYIGRHTHAHLARQRGKPLDDIAADIGNLPTTAERFYIRRDEVSRPGQAIDVDGDN